MPLKATLTPDTLTFALSGRLLQFTHQWAYAIDEAIFEEQLRTGMRTYMNYLLPIDEMILAMMADAKRHGSIMPYYGADSGRMGASVYHITPDTPTPRMVVKHGPTKQQLEVPPDVMTDPAPASISGARTSALTLVRHAVSGSDPVVPATATLVLAITGTVYANLQAWEQWDAAHALTARYTYRFAPVGFAPGFAVSVKDAVSGEECDINDYANW